MGLYTKQEGVHPEKSLLGCLVATIVMVLIIGAIAFFQRADFVLTDKTPTPKFNSAIPKD